MTLRYDDAQCQEYCTFDYPLDLPECSWYVQANGLVCLSNMFDEDADYDPNIFLWNPLVQKCRTVPESPLSTFTFRETRWNALAFGFLPEGDDYVVVHIVKPSLTCEPLTFDYLDFDPPVAYEQFPHTVVIGVYSLKTNSWKKICQDKVFVDRMDSDQSVIVNGTAFWVGCYYGLLEQSVMYFDTKTNILRKVTLSPYIDHFDRQLDNPLILPFGESIAYFVEVDQVDADEDSDDDGFPHLDIWVLNDDSEFSWEKKMSVALSENIWDKVLGIRNNGEPILAKSNKLIAYDLDTHEPYDLVESCAHLTPSSYYKDGSKSPFVIRPFVGTLVFLDLD